MNGKNTEISARVQLIIKKEGGTANSFAKKLGYDRSQTIYDIMNGKSAPSYDFFNRFMYSEYSAIYSIDWLLTGRGPMERDIPLANTNKFAVSRLSALKTDHSVESQLVPLYEFEAAAGLISLFDESNPHEAVNYIMIPDLPPVDGAVYVRGDSMYPLLKSGDIILYKQMHDFSFLYWGEMYLISFRYNDEEFITVKYINKIENSPDRILLVSYNTHHAPMEIPISTIRALAIVKASIRYNTMG